MIKETSINSLQMLEVLDRFEFRCALTGSTGFHVDHWFPQKFGGLSNISNCYPLDATLNLRKNASNPFVFFEREDIRPLFPKEKFDDLVFWLAVNNDMTIEEFRDYTNKVYETGDDQWKELRNK